MALRPAAGCCPELPPEGCCLLVPRLLLQHVRLQQG
jgi:hypothetical protein